MHQARSHVRLDHDEWFLGLGQQVCDTIAKKFISQSPTVIDSACSSGRVSDQGSRLIKDHGCWGISNGQGVCRLVRRRPTRSQGQGWFIGKFRKLASLNFLAPNLPGISDIHTSSTSLCRARNGSAKLVFWFC
jgi:hypothetical protein